MNWRWLFFDYVPPWVPLTRTERRKVRARSWRLMNDRSVRQQLSGPARVARFKDSVLRGACAMTPPTIQGLVMLGFFLKMYFIRTTWLDIPVVVASQLILSWITLSFVHYVLRRPYVLHVLRERGYELCAGCGYWLRGLGPAVDRCPECGVPRVRVGTIIESPQLMKPPRLFAKR